MKANGIRHLAGAAALLGTFLAVGAVGGALAQNSPAAGAKLCEKKTELHFSVGTGTVTIASAPLFSVPQYMGYWEEGCLTVKGYGGKTTLSLMQLLATGQIDVAFSGPAALLQARSQGVDAISVYQIGYENLFWLAVPPDSPIKTIADLKGKTVGVNSMGDQALFLFRAMFKNAGLDPEKDVKFLALGTGAPAMQALKHGDVQAVGFWVDIYSALSNQGYDFRFIRSPIETVAGGWTTNLYVMNKFAKEQPDVLARFLRGISKGIMFARANPEAAVRMHWKQYPETKPAGVSDEEALKQGVRMINDKMKTQGPVSGLKLGEQASERVANYLKFALEYGIIKSPMDAASLMNNDFVEAANAFDPKTVEQAASSVVIPK